MLKQSNTLQRILIKLVYFSPILFPAYLIRFNILGVPVTALEIFTYVLFALWLLALITKNKRFTWNRHFCWYWLAVLLLFLGTSIGVIIAPDFVNLPSGDILNAKQIVLGIWKGWIVAPILYFMVITQTLKKKQDVEIILHFFVYSAAILCFISYGLAIFGDGVTYDMRLRGPFESANYLALYIVPALLINIHYILKHACNLRREDYIKIIALVVLMHSLFFTQSYAAILGVFGALVLYVIQLLYRKNIICRNGLITFIILMVTFVVIILTHINTSKFRQFLDWKNRSSTSVRLEIYEVSWDLINENALLGIGPGLFQANYQNRASEALGHPPMEWNIPHPHNIFMAFWFNAGLLGLLSLITFLFLTHRGITYPLIALWGIIIHGMFDTPFWKNDLSMIFWLIIGSILILQIHADNSPKKQTPNGRLRSITKPKKRVRKKS